MMQEKSLLQSGANGIITLKGTLTMGGNKAENDRKIDRENWSPSIN